MGLFSGWFSKNVKDEQDTPAIDWRAEPRRRVATAWPAIEARIGGERTQVLDMSEKGFGLALDEARAPDQALVEIWKGDELMARGYALQAWRRGSRVGYTFATGLTVERIQEKRAAQAAAKAAALMPTRVAAREAIQAATRKTQAAAAKQLQAKAARRDGGAVSYLDEDELRAIHQVASDSSGSVDGDLYAGSTQNVETAAAPTSAELLRSRLKL